MVTILRHDGFMPHRTRENCREALATISTLKRVLGIPNHASKKDTFAVEEGRLHIYTPDGQSAILLAELFYRYGTGNQAEHYKAHPEHHTIRDTIRTEQLEDGCHVEMLIPWPPSLQKALDKMIKKHVAPDSRLTR